MIGTFKRPIIIFVGLGFPRELNTPMDALEALNELPSRYCGPAHTAALKTCRAAIEGSVDAEIARGVIEAYFQARGLLAQELIAPHAIAACKDLLSA